MRIADFLPGQADLRAGPALVVRLSALGDALLTTGVLEYWRQQRGLHFHVLTRPALAPVFAEHPAVRQVIAVPEADLRGPAWLRFCLRLRAQYGHMPLIDLHDTLRTFVLRRLWPGHQTTYPKYSLTRRAFITTRLPALRRRLLTATVPQRYALALESKTPPINALRPIIFIDPEELDAGRARLKDIHAQRPIAIHPFATHHSKTLTPNAWRDVVHSIQASGHAVLIVGRAETPLFPGAPFDLTNTTDLRTTAAILAHCRALVSGDSGPMHLATAVGTPCIALFGPTTQEWGFYPSGEHDIVLQSSCPEAPCSLHGQKTCTRAHACMTSISAERILNAINALPGHDDHKNNSTLSESKD